MTTSSVFITVTLLSSHLFPPSILFPQVISHDQRTHCCSALVRLVRTLSQRRVRFRLLHSGA